MVLKREQFVRKRAQRIGEVVEVHIVLPNGFIGKFIRVRVKLDITKKLTRFIGFTKAGSTGYYQVKFEKLSVFYYMCGLFGHWHEECRSGDHDPKYMEWGPFILASRRIANANRSARRGFGRRSERDVGVFGDEDAGNAYARGRGVGRTHGCGRGYDHRNFDPSVVQTAEMHAKDLGLVDASEQRQFMQKSWRFNATNALYVPSVEMDTGADETQPG
ncbi:putative disease resistance protein RGA3 [Hordeum vulgare]|nr:putative disease resistance protein RGA3 [Hordeum vulgare]